MGHAADESLPGDRSTLLAALAAATGPVPAVLDAFDRAVLGAARVPDFLEHSLRFSQELQVHRLTYYFDLAASKPGVLGPLVDRFAHIAQATGCRFAQPLRSALAAGGAHAAASILQVVYGIEVREGEATCKFYVILRGEARQYVEACIAAAGCEAGTLDLAKTYIMGIDLGPEGVRDCKVYFRLDPAGVGRVVANLQSIAHLMAGTRDLVLQRCLIRKDRQQMYVHASDPHTIGRWLGQSGPGRLVLAHCDAVNEQLVGQRVDPWIIALPYSEGRVHGHRGNVYFHLRGA